MQLKSQWERTKKLHDGGAKVVTDNEYEIAESAFLAMGRRVERLSSAYDLMIAGMLLIGLIGLALDIFMRRLERLDFVRWGYAVD